MTNPRPTLKDLDLEPRPGETYQAWSARFDTAANLTHQPTPEPPMTDHRDLTDLTTSPTWSPPSSNTASTRSPAYAKRASTTAGP